MKNSKPARRKSYENWETPSLKNLLLESMGDLYCHLQEHKENHFDKSSFIWEELCEDGAKCSNIMDELEKRIDG